MVSKYNPCIDHGAALGLEEQTAQGIASAVEHFVSLNADEYKSFGRNAIRVAEDYDFKKLTEKLIGVIKKTNI